MYQLHLKWLSRESKKPEAAIGPLQRPSQECWGIIPAGGDTQGSRQMSESQIKLFFISLQGGRKDTKDLACVTVDLSVETAKLRDQAPPRLLKNLAK